MSKVYYNIAIYEIDRAYGGPEEGGWWYDTGVFQRTLWRTASEENAIRLCRRANKRLRHLARKGGYQRDVSSVCYSGGAYNAEIYDREPPTHYPTHRPHYE